jgi:UDP-glucose-4-epimerase GalE
MKKKKLNFLIKTTVNMALKFIFKGSSNSSTSTTLKSLFKQVGKKVIKRAAIDVGTAALTHVIGPQMIEKVINKVKCVLREGVIKYFGNKLKEMIPEEFRSIICVNIIVYKGKSPIERILKDLNIADPDFSIVILRYFNPIGAHKSGLIGDNPNGIPNNLMPYITKVAVGELPHLNIFGNDYPTKDGTGVRDYIHVIDLAIGHVKALNKVVKETGIHIYNLGTGIGYSVLDIVNAFEKVNNIKIPYVIKERREGDIAKCYADPSKAKQELGFEAKYTIEDMVKDSYQFYINNKKSN